METIFIFSDCSFICRWSDRKFRSIHLHNQKCIQNAMNSKASQFNKQTALHYVGKYSSKQYGGKMETVERFTMHTQFSKISFNFYPVTQISLFGVSVATVTRNIGTFFSTSATKFRKLIFQCSERILERTRLLRFKY